MLMEHTCGHVCSDESIGPAHPYGERSSVKTFKLTVGPETLFPMRRLKKGDID